MTEKNREQMKLTEEEVDNINCTYEQCGKTKHNTDAHRLAEAQLDKYLSLLNSEKMGREIQNLYCEWCPQDCKGLTKGEKLGCLASGGFADELISLITQKEK